MAHSVFHKGVDICRGEGTRGRLAGERRLAGQPGFGKAGRERRVAALDAPGNAPVDDLFQLACLTPGFRRLK
jgi:hypothetical protein